MNAQATQQPYTAVVGLGQTGLACARFLCARGVAVRVTDSREQPPGLDALRRELPAVPVSLGALDGALLCGAEQVVLSPGVDPAEPAVQMARERGVPVIGEIELFARHARAPVIAITGSNGKSTVTSLVGEMAQAAGVDVAVGGNLGTNALALIREPEAELYVLELSSFQLETTDTLAPVAAAVLNLSADHLDRYSGMAEYAAAKERIYRHARLLVVNRDDPAVRAMARSGRRVMGFTLHEPTRGDYGLRAHQGGLWLARGEQPLLDCTQLKIAGRHNQANALAALALGEAAGLPLQAMLGALRAFTGLPHRTEWVGEGGGVRWYNDSKGTNVGATLAAVQGLPGPLVLIMGGIDKDGDFSPLRDPLVEKARGVILIGRDAPRIEQALRGAVRMRRAGDMGEAVRLAAELAEPGDAVLLSPACASFDMYSGFEARGDDFRRRAREVLA
ncbi:UDP-N-acetylmuramoyl-L-alanine--D-glutamate ligase [Alkalilimnicola sp. S0819]|uniref:UDP-N-acetylmuramoyl-L-alanine--D-glutamate ligase n=1 Tax=Alkalilimnicola sp. S0819 TaxID=2613922 RepID=UPI00126229BE|nr:UDP-N-acetylmuramoyl-L-alanine--D-glutamate ligase [Alkalilimnicola sp. S0819]KAB7623854.1 UDP-N-acetylmuramoyl-L-alanine--D-glutamate ligase [Alkalilimnicola sp. S0819]MPQ16731.1 UDP-N-acetylmuramoyl-L-alanine--D-glutamate ligase [Alkalilimnicola sp. S0819]